MGSKKKKGKRKKNKRIGREKREMKKSKDIERDKKERKEKRKIGHLKRSYSRFYRPTPTHYLLQYTAPAPIHVSI